MLTSESAKKISNVEPVKKIQIKQFQWFEVETKVRELLTQLLQPFTKKQSDDTLKLNEFKRNLISMTKKIEDHQFLLQKQNAQKPTYIQLQDDKIANLQQQIKQFQAAQNKKISEMQKVIQVYQAKVTQLNQLESKMDEQISQRHSQFKQYKDHVENQIQLMLKRLDTQDNQFNNLRQTTRNAVTKIQTKTVVLENRTITLEDQMKRKTQQLQRVTDQIILMNQKLQAVDLATKQLDVRMKERQKDYKLSQKFLTKTSEIQNQLNFIKNYLRFYQPLYNQMQISETINIFLRGNMKIKTCLFEQKLFAHMHQAILTMEEDSLQAKMGDYSNRIRRIINRNKKYLIKLKVEQTLRYGNNIYEIRQVDESIFDQGEQQVAKPTQIIVPQEQIVKIIQQKWEKMTKSLQNTIEQKTSPFKVWIKELQEQAILREIQLQKRVQDIKSKLALQQANAELFKTDIVNAEKEGKKQKQTYIKQLKKVKDQIKDIVNFSSVINHIVIQDQIDRQGMALYALRSGNGDGSSQKIYPNVHLDEKCISCKTGNSAAIVNQAFKMACLAYSPSQIKVDDRSFSREEILELSTNILDKLKKKIDDIQLFEKKQQNNATIPKSRSKSLVNKNISLNTTPQKQMNTIDVLPNSSRLRDTTYLLPVLGAVKKKTSAISHRSKINS